MRMAVSASDVYGALCYTRDYPMPGLGQNDSNPGRLLPLEAPNFIQYRTDMKRYKGILTVCLSVFLASPARGQTAETAEPSAFLHVLAGASGAFLVSAVAYPLIDSDSDRRDAALVAGLGVGGAFVLGLTKELLDLGGWGQPQLSDLLLTLGGGLIAGTAVYLLSTLQPAGEERGLGISPVYAAFALVLSLPVAEGLYRRTRLSLRSRS
jgi:hypothetical protein